MNRGSAFWTTRVSPVKKQRGIVAVIVTIGMVALLAVTGLALDSGHMLMNKTRIQNAADAAALAAARTLQTNTGDMTLARSVANTVFNNNLSGELSDQSPSLTVTFSENLNPGSFANTVTTPRYVKVASTLVPLQSFLIRVVGFNSKGVAATAVAGFANGANFCSLIPVMVCQGPDSDQSGNVNGYITGDEYDLKFGSQSGPDDAIGTGNFHLLDLPGLQGANDIRYAFAGNPACAGLGQGQPIDVAPGNKVGPTVQGINTRFGIYSGPLNSLQNKIDYPADWANDDPYINNSPCPAEGCLSYTDYTNFYTAETPPMDGQHHRRIVTVPIGNCDGTTTGNNTTMTVQNFACFLLTQPGTHRSIKDDPNTPEDESSEGGALRGAFTEQELCTPPGSGVTTSSGADIIVLYKNPDGDDA
ncbi:TadE/TadG family type IV pilus assembly protein [Amphritea balenae]|nr:pilus assembly protein TadG-related protein [Amphritea balenae]GGK59279.1 hypothetical protein GCM10007941_06880 [Amphritea balenae]